MWLLQEGMEREGEEEHQEDEEEVDLFPVLHSRPLSDHPVSMIFMVLCHIGGETIGVVVSTALLAC